MHLTYKKLTIVNFYKTDNIYSVEHNEQFNKILYLETNNDTKTYAYGILRK